MPKASTQQRKALDTYHAEIGNYQKQGVTHEQATRLAFSTLLDTLARAQGWMERIEDEALARKKPPSSSTIRSRSRASRCRRSTIAWATAPRSNG